MKFAHSQSGDERKLAVPVAYQSFGELRLGGCTSPRAAVDTIAGHLREELW